MYSKKFLFSGLCIELLSKKEIRDSGFFNEYLSAAEPDITVRVIDGPLPSEKGRLLCRTQTAEFYRRDNADYMYSFFYIGEMGEYYRYALRVIDGDNITLYIDYKDGMWDSMVFDALGIADILLEKEIAVIHSSYIIYNGVAVIFSADKQVGKSTQAALWEKYRSAEVINGDRCALAFENGVLYASGVPFCGSSKISVNKSAELKAIVLLRQAGENTVERVSPVHAFVELLGKLTYNEWDSASLEKASSLTEKIISAVPVYRLSCLPDEGAVETLEGALFKKE